jgi:hypothetical protein
MILLVTPQTKAAVMIWGLTVSVAHKVAIKVSIASIKMGRTRKKLNCCTVRHLTEANLWFQGVIALVVVIAMTTQIPVQVPLRAKTEAT